MSINFLKHLFYSLYLVNKYGFKLRKIDNPQEIKSTRLQYAKEQLNSLNVKVKVENIDKLPSSGQYLVVSNHKSIIDPPIVEVALKDTTIFGPWIAKKELYNSIFFGLFVRHGGSILLDRQKSQMGGFFAEVKEAVKRGESIFIFPEGTRLKGNVKLGKFKEGSRIIALKNRLPILPIYIKTDAQKVLKDAIENNKIEREVVVVVGDIIDYKDRTNLETNYRKMFNI